MSVACLTIYDMLKAVDRAMRIEGVKLLSKSGGASGDFVAAWNHSREVGKSPKRKKTRFGEAHSYSYATLLTQLTRTSAGLARPGSTEPRSTGQSQITNAANTAGNHKRTQRQTKGRSRCGPGSARKLRARHRVSAPGLERPSVLGGSGGFLARRLSPSWTLLRRLRRQRTTVSKISVWAFFATSA